MLVALCQPDCTMFCRYLFRKNLSTSLLIRMGQQTYNRFFHLHTVSGIVICVGLYIIFFAGAFSIFRDEIEEWESNIELETSVASEETRSENILSIVDYDDVLRTLSLDYNLSGRDVSFMSTLHEDEITIFLGGSSDSLASEVDKEYSRLYLNIKSKTFNEYTDSYSLGSLLYDLHFFEQLGPFGELLAGFVSLFFLFAIITGVIVHWKKIISNFYVFRPLAKLKTIWTDAHTALGIIGLPFQFMYAVTGAYFCLSILLVPKIYLYDGDRGAYYEDMGTLWPDFPMLEKEENTKAINPYINQTLEKWKGYEPTYIAIKNLGNKNMHLQVDGKLSSKQRFIGFGTIIYHVGTGEVVKENNPFQSDYVDGVRKTVYKLHFGIFNYFYRTIYFILAIITCFVIISGVLIWLTARDKKNISEKKRRFNSGVGHIYLAICLSIFPITAFAFIFSKLLPESMNAQRESLINWFFFGGWLLLSILFWLKRDNQLTNKYTLLSGGILSLCIPIVNGFSSENWIWKTFSNEHYTVFIIDMIWLCLGVISLFAAYRIEKNKH